MNWKIRGPRLAGTALAAVVTLAGLLVGTAGTAYAVPNPGLHTATSSYDSLAVKVATVTCPAGESVYGTGADIRDGAGEVATTAIVPNAALTSVTVWAQENGNFAGDWEVTAQAVCGPTSGTAQLVTVFSAFNGATPKVLTAACPAGTNLYATGYQLLGSMGEVFVSRLVPNAALDTVLVRGDEDGAFGGMWSVTLYAVCDAPAAAMGPFFMVSANNAASPKSVTSPLCPAGSHVHGLGGEISPSAFGDVLMDSLTPSSTLDTVTAGAQENGPFAMNWTVTSYAICST